MKDQSRLEEFKERYQAGEIPWDDTLPPPEVVKLASDINPGQALDLGCGYGRTSIYLAANGWSAVGIDFVSEAIEVANKRSADAGLSDVLNFFEGDVTNLSFLQSQFDLVIDIGCMHTLHGDDLKRYKDGVIRLLKKSGYYLLFAHLYDPSSEDDGEIQWIKDEEIMESFVPPLTMEWAEYGITQVPDKPPWRSVWYLFRK